MELSNEKPTNGELEIMIKNTDKNLNEFRAETKESLREINKKMDSFIECAEDRFASKWVEKAVWGGCAVIITGVIVAVLNLIIK